MKVYNQDRFDTGSDDQDYLCHLGYLLQIKQIKIIHIFYVYDIGPSNIATY